jgi:hypothetical protein
MLKTIRVLPLFVLVASAIGQVAVPAQEAASAATYQLRALQASGHSLQGKLIKLQFVCRSSITEPTADGGLTGEVVDSPGTRITASVKVPKEAVEWFMNVPTTYKGGPPFTIYARLSTDKFGAPVAVLLGREARSDAGGSRIEW